MNIDKQKFIIIRQKHHFNILELAEQAQVAPDIVYHMLLEDPVPRDSAIRVLDRLSEQTGVRYTIDNVYVQFTSF
jgi:hypothetical protein